MGWDEAAETNFPPWDLSLCFASLQAMHSCGRVFTIDSIFCVGLVILRFHGIPAVYANRSVGHGNMKALWISKAFFSKGGHELFVHRTQVSAQYRHFISCEPPSGLYKQRVVQGQSCRTHSLTFFLCPCAPLI